MFKNADIVVSYCDNIVAIRTTNKIYFPPLGLTYSNRVICHNY